MMPQNVKRAVLTFLGVTLLAAGVVFGVLATQNKVIFNQKAAPTTAEKIAEIAKSIGESKSQANITYSSVDLGYSLSFNKNYWNPSKETNLKTNDLKSLSFNLNTGNGIAKVDFQTFGNTELTKKINAGKTKVSGGDNLDALANGIAMSNPPVSKLRIRRNGKDYYKFTYNTTFLNQKVTYYTYVTINGDSYHSFTARYPSFGDGSSMAEGFIDSFSFLPNPAEVKGASATSLPTTALDESKIVELTKPSVVEIAHIYCNDIKISDTSGLHYLKPSYKYCDGALGSGFVINKDGFIATNGHVAVQFPDSSLVQGLISQNPYSQGFFIDLIRELVFIQNGQDISEEQAKTLLSQASTDPTYFEAFVTLIYKMVQQKIIGLSLNSEKHFVKLANDPIVIDGSKAANDFMSVISTSQTIKEAKLVSFNYPNELSVEGVLNGKKETGSDVAIIKITDPGDWVFPSVSLGTSDGLKEGSEVIVIGYPGLVSGGKDSLINQKSSATPTITKGVISAIKNDQAGLKLIQVDASIDHGNSGGPAFDLKGDVIGIATYGIGSQSGNYNFLRDVEDLKKLAAANSVTMAPSPTYIEWAEGLGYFWREHYKQAVGPFDKVEASYPIHPLAANYSNDSQEAIKKGQDKSDFIFLLAHDRATQITFFGVILGLFAIGFTTFTIIKRNKNGVKPPTTSGGTVAQNNTPAMAQPTLPQNLTTPSSPLPQNPEVQNISTVAPTPQTPPLVQEQAYKNIVNK